ncbi:diguanylate cyclase [Gaiella sp.]|uniref:diguanylate cyclase n=1 Tax=Gaiella sp. TaxID=2663207 RepID=UPI0039831E3C
MRTSLHRRWSPTGDPSDAALHLAELGALNGVAALVAERHETPVLLRLILSKAAALFGVDDGHLYLVEPDRDGLSLAAGTGAFSDRVGDRIRFGEQLAGRVASGGEALAAVDDTAAVAAPLRGREGMLGVIGLVRAGSSRFSEDEVALLDRFCRIAGIALDNVLLHDSVQAELTERHRTEEELLDTVSRLSRSELELRQAQAETIRRLADAAEFRDEETGHHTERMSRMCEKIARRLGLDEDRCRLLREASPLHDIGKIAIPDEILLKRGQFTDQERRTMQRHAEIGHRLLTGSASEVLDLAATIALVHHERWDGHGYPYGLEGEAIPLEGRIAAVADVFDALTTERVYRSALPVETALEMMREQRGAQFDPLVFDVLEDIAREADEVTDIETGADVAAALSVDETLVQVERDEASPTPRETSAADKLSERQLRRACRTAERRFEGLQGRGAIEEALATLCEPFQGSLLASLYVVEHDRLWLVAQHGYAEVRDGFDLDHGVMGRAIRTRTIQVVAEVTAGATPGSATSEVAIPFQAGSDIVGVLTVESVGLRLPRSPGAVLVPLASRLGERLSESREGVESGVEDLVRLCVHASSLRGIGAIAELATRTTGRILGLSSTQLDLWREDDIQPRLVSFWRRHDVHLEPLDSELLMRLERGAGEHISSSVVAAQQVGLRDGSTSSLVVIPLRAGGAPVGLLTGRLTGSPPTKERLEAATLFAQHTAALIDVATALRREQRAAVTDQLTGLLNRRGFEERFDEELRRGTHDDHPVSVVLCDCDGLKTMNDLRGHETGDALIELIASCLRTHKRVSDVAARIGGDEFAILLPDADIETALAVAERIRGSIAAETLAGFRPSASFGVASFPLHGSSTTEVIKRADEALYLAKQRGGDEIAAFAH